MPLVPRARLTYLGFFSSFFISYSLFDSSLGGEWRVPLRAPCQHQPSSELYLE